MWYHLPEARGGVEMRYRRVGETHWTAHELAVQVLPGGWWRTGEWPHAGDVTWEQGCWVDETCVMAKIYGPAGGHILDELPPGDAPPAPHGIGTDGKGIVRVRNGRVVSQIEMEADAKREAESDEERRAALADIFDPASASIAPPTATPGSGAAAGGVGAPPTHHHALSERCYLCDTVAGSW